MHTFRVVRESSVTAALEERAHSLILAKGMTLGGPSDRLADLGQGHDGNPVTGTVRFGASPRKAAYMPIRRSDFGDTSSKMVLAAA
jgi:hypothetical protein